MGKAYCKQYMSIFIDYLEVTTAVVVPSGVGKVDFFSYSVPSGILSSDGKQNIA